MWIKIAKQIHEDTKDAKTIIVRGKTSRIVDCRVQASDSSLRIWFDRKVKEMDDSYSASKEKTTSGHGGHMNARVREFAKTSDTTEEEIKAESTHSICVCWQFSTHVEANLVID